MLFGADGMTEKIKLGISSCLLGNLVRFEGTHQLYLDTGAFLCRSRGMQSKSLNPVSKSGTLTGGRSNSPMQYRWSARFIKREFATPKSVTRSFYWKIR